MGQDEVRSFYERYWARPSDAPPSHDPDSVRRLRMVEAALRRHSAKHVLDVGCGRGDAAAHLQERGFRVGGMELVESAVKEATLRHPQVPFVNRAVEDEPWPYPDSSFDAVISLEVIEHLLDPRPLLRQAARIVRPGGVVVISTPYHGYLKNLLLCTLSFDKHFCNLESGHIRFYSDTNIGRIAEEQGLDVEAINHYGRFWPIWSGLLLAAVRAERHPTG